MPRCDQAPNGIEDPHVGVIEGDERLDVFREHRAR
jgi:hypothetical protein